MKPVDFKNIFLEFDLFSTDEIEKINLLKDNLIPTNYTVKLDDKFYPVGSSMGSQDLIKTRETDWIYSKVQNSLTKHLNVDWKDSPHGVFREYNKDDFFIEHKDNVDKSGSDPRYFTVTIQLSSPLEYEGGEVIVNRGIEISKNLGTAAIWGSDVIHEVKKILNGSRSSLVFFISSKHINLKKSLI